MKDRVKRKREREPFIDVANKRPKAAAKHHAIVKPQAAKPQAVIPLTTRRVVAGVSSSRLTTVARADTEASTNNISLEHAEKIEVGDPRRNFKLAKEEEEGRRFKRRHTDETPDTQPLDHSHVDADDDKVAAQLGAVDAPIDTQLWNHPDAEGWDDPVMGSEYIAEICKYFKEIEVRVFISLNPPHGQPLIFAEFQLATLPNRDYMMTQAHITWEHRGILVDWLLQLHANYRLHSESLFLCINLLDRFLGSCRVSLDKLQLVGLVCFFIATKFEETCVPSVKQIALLADDQYPVEEILRVERYVLKTVKWDLRAPGPMGWLRRGSQADGCEVNARTMAEYLLLTSLVEKRFIGVVPSLLSAAALWLSRLTLGREEWVRWLVHRLNPVVHFFVVTADPQSRALHDVRRERAHPGGEHYVREYDNSYSTPVAVQKIRAKALLQGGIFNQEGFSRLTICNSIYSATMNFDDGAWAGGSQTGTLTSRQTCQTSRTPFDDTALG